MSAQGTTLGRGTAIVPMGPIAVLIALAATMVLAVSLLDTRPTTQAPPRTLVARFANSGAIPAASTDEANTFAPRTLVERFANAGVIPAASTDEANPLVQRLANAGVIPAASTHQAG